jgi:hypothetical protein
VPRTHARDPAWSIVDQSRVRYGWAPT